MSNAQLHELLHALRLPGMREEFEHQMQHTGYGDMPFPDRILRMAQAETERRLRNKIDRLMKAAQFKYSAQPEEVDYRVQRKLDKSLFLDLLKCEWIARRQNILFTGPAGTGKTWLACALGIAAARKELATLYVRVGRLAEELAYARLDGTITKLRLKYSRLDLLIIDEFALSAMSRQEITDVFEVVEDRSSASSIILIGQRPVQDWHSFIGDPLLADAFMDRIRSRAHLIALDGPSLRE